MPKAVAALSRTQTRAKAPVVILTFIAKSDKMVRYITAYLQADDFHRNGFNPLQVCLEMHLKNSRLTGARATRDSIMRKMIYTAAAVLAVTPTIAVAQAYSYSNNGAVGSGLLYTKERANLRYKQIAGRRYIIEHSSDKKQLIALTEKCHRLVTRPEYCAVFRNPNHD